MNSYSFFTTVNLQTNIKELVLPCSKQISLIKISHISNKRTEFNLF